MSQLPKTIEAMLDPSFYPHPVQEAVRLLQTHISYVFLTGEYAYKVKKPVNFGFLDFSDLASRRHYCLEELRLNKRLSPDLYLEVHSIIDQNGKYQLASLDAAGPVEYALRMLEFPQEGLFSHLFEKGKLSAEEMKTLAEIIADFHSSTAISEGYGTPESIYAIAEENYSATRPFIGKFQTAEQFEMTRQFTTRFLKDHEDWFRDRVAQRKIRECHGDLHLNNICYFQDRIQVFDCIEFNERFRNIDVMYEAAFLIMDLEFRKRPDLATAFLNKYMEATGDYRGVALLPFYCSLRATVRAKVHSLTAEEETPSEEEKKESGDLAELYYKQAASYSERNLGFLIMMSGLSGSGKSTVAEIISRRTGAIHIRSDAVRKRLAGIDLKSPGAVNGRFESGIYTPEMTRRTYSELQNLGFFLAPLGKNVILDAKYDCRDEREEVITCAEKENLRVRIVHCVAPDTVLATRLSGRKDISEASPELLQDQRRKWQDFSGKEKEVLFEIDTTSNMDREISRLLQVLDN